MTPAVSHVSVIIPVYNGERFLLDAIDNIEAQGLDRYEILVIDDGSTDSTAAILTALGNRIRSIHQPNRGPAAARNRGLALAQGNVIAFLDVDDLWSPGALRNLLAHLDAHPQIDIAQGLIQRLRLERDGSAPVFRPVGEAYQFVNLGSAVYRREVFDRVGPLNEALTENEDTDWFIRAWEENVPKAVLPRPVLLYRLHEDNLVHRQSLVGRGIPRLLQLHRNRLRHVAADAVTPRVSVRDYLGDFPPPLRCRAPLD